MVRYARKIDGKVAWRGEWRRTIRNGYTLTIDMRVVGRNVTSGDISALNRIQNSISFVTMTEAPEALLTLAFSAPPPESTNSDTFTIKGTTRPGASVVAAYAALQSSKSKVFSTTADAKGVGAGGDVAHEPEHRIAGKEALGQRDAAVCGIVERALEPLR